MGYLLQQAINGVTLGCIYGLLAMGYTLIHGIIGQFHLAFGEIFMIGAFSAFIVFVLTDILGISLLPALLVLALALAVLSAAAHAWGSHRWVYRPLRGTPSYAPLVATLGLSVFLQEYVRLMQSSGALWLRPLQPAGVHWAGAADGFEVVVTQTHLTIVALTAAALTAVWLVHLRTRFGRAQRACAQDMGMAALLGISTERTIGITFIMAGALAATAGVLANVQYGVVDSYMGFVLGLKAIIAAVVGGIGSPLGAVLGGLLVGFLETFWSAYFSLLYRDVVVFSLLVAVLILRPGGLVGVTVLDTAPGVGRVRT